MCIHKVFLSWGENDSDWLESCCIAFISKCKNTFLFKNINHWSLLKKNPEILMSLFGFSGNETRGLLYEWPACVLLILSFVPFSIVITVCDWSVIHLYLITVSLLSAVWTSWTWQTLWHVSVSNQTPLLRTAVCLPSSELWHQLLLLMVLHLKKNIWLLNKSTALIRCNYSNNNNKKPHR